MSGSAIADAIVTMLSATSCIGTDAVSTDYVVLEKTSGSCAVVNWVGMNEKLSTFGDPADKEIVWTHLIMGFVKDEGDPIEIYKRVLDFPDKVVTTLRSDDTLQGTVEMVKAIRGRRDPELAARAGAATWLPVFFEVDSLEWTDD